MLTGAILAFIAVFYLLNPRPIVGDALVNTPRGTPEEWPSASSFPLYVKPVTIMLACVVLFSFSFFSLARAGIRRIPNGVRVLLMLVSLVIFSTSIYETLFGFLYWGSQLTAHADPDLVVYPYLGSSIKVNLVFATKAFLSLCFASYFAFEALRSAPEPGRANT